MSRGLEWILAAALLMYMSMQSVLAGDCWVSTIENTDTGFGDVISAPRHGGFRATLHQVESLLKADPVIGAMRDVRYQQHIYIGESYHAGAPKSGEVSVYLHKPAMWGANCSLKRGADVVHFVELVVALNDLTSLGAPAEIGGGDVSDAKYFQAPKRVGERGGYPIYENAAGNRVMVMAANVQSPFAPVTVGEYLDDWQIRLQIERDAFRRDSRALADDSEWQRAVVELRKIDPKGADALQKEMEAAAAMATEGDPAANAEWEELQRLRNTLTSTQRAQPVYLSSATMEHFRFGYAQPGDAEGVALVKLNPALWSEGRSESAVRVVTLQVLIQDGESARHAGADRWLEQVDVGRYRKLLEGAAL